MANLQKANLGTPPTGAGGDDQRAANTKFNANVDVLSAQAALTTASPITSSQVLTAARHLGRRVSINIAAGGTITLPAASECAADGVLHIRNVGKAIAIAVAAGSGDALALTKLNSGEAVLLDTDGVNAWRVLMRGRAYGDDEVVNGALSVGGNLAAGGSLTINGRIFAPEGTATAPGIAFQNDGAPDTGFFHISDGVFGVTCNTQEVVRYGPGAVSYKVRPTFAGKVPWDNGNFDPSGKLSVAGRTDGIEPAPGNVGEIVTTSNSTISLPGNRTPVGTTTLNLGPGEWDVQGSMIFNFNASGVLLTMAFVGVASSSGSIVAGQFAGIDGLSTQGWATFTTPMVRFRFSRSTTIWLNAQAAANANVPGFGHLTARRVAA